MADAPFSPGRGEDREPGPPAPAGGGRPLTPLGRLCRAWHLLADHPLRAILLLALLAQIAAAYAPAWLARLLEAAVLLALGLYALRG